MTKLQALLKETCAGQFEALIDNHDMLILECRAEQLIPLCTTLKDAGALAFEQLIDVLGVDYATYGMSEWETHTATATGFSRGLNQDGFSMKHWDKPRFAVVYHLLSLTHNHRLRVRVFLNEDNLKIPSVVGLWASANWAEREVFDLFGVVFDGHTDLRRLLTDYGFTGHPFRKDFPLVGDVEMRYDAAKGRCVYEPVTIQPRVTVPRVIRDDSRYVKEPQDD